MLIKILDPGLLSKAGHHYSFDKTLVSIAEGIEIYALKNMALTVKEEGWAVPMFTNWLYASDSQDTVTASLDDFLKFSEDFEFDLIRGGLSFTENDVIVMHTAMPWAIYGLARYLKKFGQKPHKVKILHALPGVSAGHGRYTELLVYYKKAFKELAFLGDKLDVGVITEWLLPEAATMGLRAKVVPPVAPNLVPIKEASEKPLFGFLGHANGVKGLPLLLEAIKMDKSNNFLLHINPPQDFTQENTEVVQGEVDKEGYVGLLERMDVIVLPYNENYYRDYTSGVFLEAVCSGRPVIIPENTWMEHEAKKQGAGYVTFKSGSVVSLKAAIDKVAENWSELSRKSAKAALFLREKYSAEAFLRWMQS